MMIEMDLVEIQVSETTGSQVVTLQEKDGARNFQIYIGPYEAAILDHAVKGQQAPRPLTHDLVLNVIDGLGGKLTGVLVDELRNDTFYGKLLVRTGAGEVERIDSRPSDAIVLAMKEKAPIYVEDEVLEMTSGDDEESSGLEEESDDDAT
ncbi:bifunctional nuclease family protein [soil metagenome]